jgi:hypothetical protein
MVVVMSVGGCSASDEDHQILGASDVTGTWTVLEPQDLGGFTITLTWVGEFE